MERTRKVVAKGRGRPKGTKDAKPRKLKGGDGGYTNQSPENLPQRRKLALLSNQQHLAALEKVWNECPPSTQGIFRLALEEAKRRKRLPSSSLDPTLSSHRRNLRRGVWPACETSSEDEARAKSVNFFLFKCYILQIFTRRCARTGAQACSRLDPRGAARGSYGCLSIGRSLLRNIWTRRHQGTHTSRCIRTRGRTTCGRS